MAVVQLTGGFVPELFTGILTLLLLFIVGIGMRRSRSQRERDLETRNAMDELKDLESDSSAIPPQKRAMSRRTLIVVWATGLGVAAFLSLARVVLRGNESRWSFKLQNWLWEHQKGWLVPLVNPIMDLDLSVLSPSPEWALWWSVLILVIWAFRRYQSSQEGLRSRKSFFALGWLAGTIFLVNWGVLLIGFIMPGVFPHLSTVAILFPIVVIWSAIVFLVFLFVGVADPIAHENSDPSGIHPTYLAPHRLIWATLVLVTVTTMLANHAAYRGVAGRTDGLMAAREVSGTTIGELLRSSNELTDLTRENIDLIEIYDQSTGFRGDEGGISRGSVLRQIEADLPELNAWVSDTKTTAIAAQAQLQSAIETEAERDSGTSEGRPVDMGASLVQTQHVLKQAGVATLRLDSLIDQIEAELLELNADDLRPLANLEAIFFTLASDAEDTRARAEVAQRTFSAVDPSVLPIFLTTALFYSVFVLFPWFLLLLFLYRKRERRAAQIIEDLELMDPTHRLLIRAIGQDIAHNPDPQNKRHHEVLFIRAFSSFEYVLSLTLLTIISAVGWYYFLYPRSSLGLAELVRTGSGVSEFTLYLTDNASPISFGFAGAYFFTVQMLVRRYLSSDLYPSAFLQAAERFLRVFILSLVLAVMLPLLDIESKALAASIAFFGGMWPSELQRFLTKQVNRLMTASFQQDTQMAPLTDLDGVDIWVETRLLEENIENVQGLATAGIETLILGTYYPGSRVIDWVDQSILYLHAGDRKEWLSAFRQVGIRTASDLLDALGVDVTAPGALATGDFAPDDDHLIKLAQAITDATGATAQAPSKLTTEVLRQIADSIWPEPNMQYVLRYLTAVANRLHQEHVGLDDRADPSRQSESDSLLVSLAPN